MTLKCVTSQVCLEYDQRIRSEDDEKIITRFNRFQFQNAKHVSDDSDSENFRRHKKKHSPERNGKKYSSFISNNDEKISLNAVNYDFELNFC